VTGYGHWAHLQHFNFQGFNIKNPIQRPSVQHDSRPSCKLLVPKMNQKFPISMTICTQKQRSIRIGTQQSSENLQDSIQFLAIFQNSMGEHENPPAVYRSMSDPSHPESP
jgi:hypothetical protein